MVKEIKDVVTWLKNWFYDKTEVYTKNETYKKSEVDTALNSKLNSNLTTANKMLVTDGSGDVILENKPVIPDITVKADKTGGVQQITDSNAHTHINSSANATQGAINTAIDTAIGTLQSIKAIEVVSDKGTASADKLGKLFIVNENSKINVYYVKQTGTGTSATYSWEKMDTNILDELDATGIKDPNAHSNIGSIINATQATINTLIDNELSDINLRLGETKVFFVNQNLLPTDTSDWGYEELYIVNYNYTGDDWRIYYWLEIGEPYLHYELNYIRLSERGENVTSIALVPKGNDPLADAYNGVIRLYYGDEP